MADTFGCLCNGQSFVLAGRMPLHSATCLGRWAQTLGVNHANDWFRGGHATLIWGSECKEKSLDWTGLLGNIFVPDKQKSSISRNISFLGVPASCHIL